MIYKITHECGETDWCIAKDLLHLLKSYDRECEIWIQEITELEELTEQEAKEVKVYNPEPYDETDVTSLWELAGKTLCHSNFEIIASTTWCDCQ
ncbi:MAG TPA: hypothetical protein PLS84_03225 [Salinivirgaceae bacterium]|nr:hypothetical protein [Salinivirgaceae bacterium]